ncbi:hypothetical protein BBJ28_00013516 [Nothophytophthora sp. Chile5]|nr:hypothetical protein BBJ28_00013516 [Nothophytophthora sp. Chile5]
MLGNSQYSRLAKTAISCLALALSSSIGLTHAEELCSIVPYSYTAAKTRHPEFASALETLEGYAIASWYTDRQSTEEHASMLSDLLSECSEDTRLSIVVYGIPNKDCAAGFSSGGSVQSTSDYQAFLKELTDAVGDRKVLYVVEPDAVGLLTQDGGCGASAGYLDNLKIAVEALSANSNAQLYVDVGYWMLAYESSAAKVATVMKELGGSGTVKGVTINTSNYRSTDEVAGYCTNFQAAMGSQDMTCIVDTSRNYNGSPTSDWCNVLTAGIGKPPTSETGVSNLDYFMWIKPPGESDGECTSGTVSGKSMSAAAAGSFFDEGFQLLWDQGYFLVGGPNDATSYSNYHHSDPDPDPDGGPSHHNAGHHDSGSRLLGVHLAKQHGLQGEEAPATALDEWLMGAYSSCLTMPATFLAVQYESFGNPLEEIKLNRQAKLKSLQPSQVRVKVLSAAVNPADFLIIQAGASFLGKSPSTESPFGVGLDVAGIIVELGNGDVDDFQVGDAVYGLSEMTDAGAFAEYVNLDVKSIAKKPANITFNEAAGVPGTGETSYQVLVEYGKLQTDQCLLILGGSSACGMFAIQIAKALGAEVIATCSAQNMELLKSLGADQVIDYTQEKWGDVLAEHSVDLIYDCGMEPDSWNDEAQKTLKRTSGIFVTIGRMTDAPVEATSGATLYQVNMTPRRIYLEALTKLIETDKIKTIIDSVHPLENVVEAIKRQMTRHAKGKIIIQVVNE